MTPSLLFGSNGVGDAADALSVSEMPGCRNSPLPEAPPHTPWNWAANALTNPCRAETVRHRAAQPNSIPVERAVETALATGAVAARSRGARALAGAQGPAPKKRARP